MRYMECDEIGEWMFCPWPWHWRWGEYISEDGEVCRFYGLVARFVRRATP